MSTVHVPQSAAPAESPSASAPTARQSADPITPSSVVPQRHRLADALQARFRLHSEDDEAPPAARLFILSFWAALSIFIGLIPAGRLVVMLALETGPWWYPATAACIGLVGLGFITAAFASVHRRYLPWYLMTISTLLLAANVAMVYTIPTFT